MKGIQKKTRIRLVLSGIFFVLVAGGYSLAVHALSKKSTEVAAMPIRTRELVSGKETQQDAKHLLLETQDAHAEIENVFFTEAKLAVFLDEIESLAKNMEVSMELRSVDVRTGAGLAITADMKGSWQNIWRLLLLLEMHPAPIVIERVLSGIAMPASGAEISGVGAWDGSVSFVLKSYIEK